MTKFSINVRFFDGFKNDFHMNYMSFYDNAISIMESVSCSETSDVNIMKKKIIGYIESIKSKSENIYDWMDKLQQSVSEHESKFKTDFESYNNVNQSGQVPVSSVSSNSNFNIDDTVVFKGNADLHTTSIDAANDKNGLTPDYDKTDNRTISLIRLKNPDTGEEVTAATNDELKKYKNEGYTDIVAYNVKNVDENIEYEGWVKADDLSSVSSSTDSVQNVSNVTTSTQNTQQKESITNPTTSTYSEVDVNSNVLSTQNNNTNENLQYLSADALYDIYEQKKEEIDLFKNLNLTKEQFNEIIKDNLTEFPIGPGSVNPTNKLQAIIESEYKNSNLIQ